MWLQFYLFRGNPALKAMMILVNMVFVLIWQPKCYQPKWKWKKLWVRPPPQTCKHCSNSRFSDNIFSLFFLHIRVRYFSFCCFCIKNNITVFHYLIWDNSGRFREWHDQTRKPQKGRSLCPHQSIDKLALFWRLVVSA